MFKETNNYQLEYLSLILVLSFFLLHNIFLVLIGLCIAIYEINKDKINLFIKYDKSRASIKESRKSVKILIPEDKDMRSSKESSKNSLAEVVEELGYIPVKQENNDNLVA